MSIRYQYYKSIISRSLSNPRKQCSRSKLPYAKMYVIFGSVHQNAWENSFRCGTETFRGVNPSGTGGRFPNVWARDANDFVPPKWNYLDLQIHKYNIYVPSIVFCVLFTLSDNITRGHCFKIQKQYSCVNCRAIVFAWNSLDKDVLCASSVQAFKRRLSLQNFTKFLYVL